MKKMTDEFIVEGIKNKNNEVFEYIYNTYYPQIKWFLLKKDIESEFEIKEIFQESVIELYLNFSDGSLLLKSSLRTIIFSICKHKYFQRLAISSRTKSEAITEELKDNMADPDLIENDLTEENLIEIRKALIRKYFSKLQKECKEVLRMFSKNVSNIEIAKKMGYKNENLARLRKHRCKEALFIMIEKDELYKQLNKDEEN